MKPKHRGDSWREAYDSKWYNWVSNSIEKIFKSQKKHIARGITTHIEVVAVVSDAEEDITARAFSIVNIIGPLLTEGDGDDTGNSMFSDLTLKVDSELSPIKSIGIVQGPVNPSSSPKIVLEGLSWCRYTKVEDWHTSIDIIDGEAKSCVGGRCLIITPQKEDSEIGLVYLRARPTSAIEGNLYESFSGSAANFKVTPNRFCSGEKFTPDDGYITVVNTMGWVAGSSGAKAQASYDPEQDEWFGTQLEC